MSMFLYLELSGHHGIMLFLRELAMQQEMIRLSSFTLKPDGRERKELSGDMNIIASLPAEPKGKKN